MIYQSATALNTSESELKAVYLFNFAKYTTWPAATFQAADDPIKFCV